MNLENYYMIAGYNFSFAYIIISIIIIRVAMKYYSSYVKDFLIKLKQENDLIQLKIAPLMASGKKELFILQQKLYRNLFIMMMLAVFKYSITIIIFLLVNTIPFNITIPLPLFYNMLNNTFVSTVIPSVAFVNVILYMFTYKIVLYIINYIRYYYKSFLMKIIQR